jgi:cation diffusion facilitator family transporter
MQHDHVFLGSRHGEAERNVWATIALTLAMMAVEIVGGVWFGSLALVSDGFHMSTHAGALLIAALAYTLARRRAHDSRFAFGTGKFGDLAGFSSALMLAVIALEIAYEAAIRLLTPAPIAFAQAIPIAVLGLVVNLASAWLLSRSGHHHHHGHDESQALVVAGRPLWLSIVEDGVPPRFQIDGAAPGALATLETVRPDGSRETFNFVASDTGLESVDTIPEPHEFEAIVRIDGAHAYAHFREHAQAGHDRHGHDNNMRAAILHVVADAGVSALVIVGLTLAYVFGWLFLDALAALAGAIVIASWSYQLLRDTGAVLLDMTPDAKLAARVRAALEADQDVLIDWHLWRLGPGHLGAIACIETASRRDVGDYRTKIAALARISHLTVEVVRRAPPREVSA